MERERRLCAPFLSWGQANERHLVENSGYGVRRVRGTAGPCAGKIARRAARGGELYRRLGAHHLRRGRDRSRRDRGAGQTRGLSRAGRGAGSAPAEADAAKTAAAADALRAVFGVKDAAVQADGALTAYLWPIGVDGRDLAAACADAGCTVTLGELRGGDADQELEKRMDLLKTLVTSACCTAPLMLEMHPKLQFLAGTALQFGPGRYFYKSAWRGARNRTFGMDFLVSLSSTLIYLYSAYVTFTPRTSYKLYFASDGVLLSLILFGKYMEQVAARGGQLRHPQTHAPAAAHSRGPARGHVC